MDSDPIRRDPDFSRDVLEELYTYPKKSRSVAWLLWATLGWLGAHRFYLRREFSGLLLLLTGGGGLLWWLVDAGLLNGMIERHNVEQESRRRSGAPPLGMEFMPPLRQAALLEAPPWVRRWRARGRSRRRLRLGGDVALLALSGIVLGSLVGVEGALEAVAGVTLLAALTTMGAPPPGFEEIPLAKSLIRWVHRLRLYYHHNEPGSPLALLSRPFLGIVSAPFRGKVRTEVKLYVQLGAAFTAAFLVVDLSREGLVPLLTGGALPSLQSFALDQIGEAVVTFFFTYAFAAPIGATLTRHLLLRPTHTLPRILGGVTLAAIGLGMLGGLF